MINKIILLLLSSTLMLACENDEQKVNAFFQKKLGVDQADSIESYISQSGKMKARLIAPVFLRYQDSSTRIVLPKTLHVDFYDSLKNIESKMDAMQAHYYENKNVVYLKDSVKVYNIKGDTLFCQELTWDQNLGKFFTDKFVRIHTPDMIMYGEGLSAPQDFKTFEIYKITNSEIRVNQ
ncbi:MAG: LPS export ABC transporter periplasmic protein LptC [Chitinophagaceae bacterium]